MTSIVFNLISSKIHPLEESMGLRIAYLLSDNLIAAGTAYREIYFEEIMSKSRMEEMINSIEVFYKNNEEEEDWTREAGEARLIWKVFNKLKHPPPDLLSRKKKFEKNITNLYESIVEELKETRKKFGGLLQLKPLHENKEFEFYPADGLKPEADEKEIKPVSKLLQLQLSDRYKPPFLFCLTPEFLMPDFINRWKMVKADTAYKANHVYVERCFSFPNLNFLSAIELQTIRRQLKETVTVFNKKMDEWIKLAGGDTFAASSNAKFFRKSVLPSTAAVLASMADNELLQNCSRLRSDEMQVDVYLGEAPIEVIWEYYRHCNLAKDETWKILTAAKENSYFKGRGPFMTYALPAKIEDLPKVNKKEEDIKPVKKSLEID